MRRFDEVTAATVGQLHQMTLAFDQHRLAEIEGDIAGEPYHTADPAWGMSKAIAAVAPRDPDVLRVQVSIASLTATSPEALADADLREKVITLGAGAPRYPVYDPGRARLLATIDRAAGPIRDSSGRAAARATVPSAPTGAGSAAAGGRASGKAAARRGLSW